MSNSWSKEDRVHFENSEVMKQLEKNLIENYKKLESIQKKFAEAPTQADVDRSAELAKNMERIQAASAADDSALGDSDDALDGSDSADTSTNLDDSDDGLADKEAVLNDLRKMIKIAIDEKEYELAYKIERTIDNLSEKEVVCE